MKFYNYDSAVKKAYRVNNKDAKKATIVCENYNARRKIVLYKSSVTGTQSKKHKKMSLKSSKYKDKSITLLKSKKSGQKMKNDTIYRLKSHETRFNSKNFF
ncbi:hypothetical protein EDEG_02437 [Edhazardia aedis USNM 41457]|uniref:Uncharacterized protein n=1 Tax=Edhazardia aedis (strain USNM 41457) TaxID=1003232 RepID=J9D6P1_EDHAE|nr:hypothetical protein EDEG_02437 [Edhazardia aedis USNM 41457]|eukprot:EJW03184.1 hypothetical protein EDEG_02437 [Edhazardia aedis USNM 41457]